MTEHRYPLEEIARRGDEIYEPIRAEMEREHDGKCVAIDIETGFYSLGDTVQDAVSPVREKNPDAEVWLVRVGKNNITRFGWRGFQMLKRGSDA
jgi:hypothetical protein